MKKPVTYTVLILDQSGSMCSRRSAAVAAYNEQVQQAKLNSKDNDIRMCLLTFNGAIFEHLWCVPADDLQLSTDEDYACAGSTALNDAVGYAVEKLKATTDWNDENNAYLIQVITDGEENASTRYPKENPTALRDLINGCQETKRWTFSFMGCDKNYLEKLSQTFAVPQSNMAAWSLDNAQAGLRAVAGSAKEYYRVRTMGMCKSQNFASESELVANYGNAEELTSGGIAVAGGPSWLDQSIGGAMVATPDEAAALAAIQAKAKTNVFGNAKSSVNWEFGDAEK